MKICYSPLSITDLERIRDFIAEHSPDSAARIATKLLQGIERLSLFPGMGYPVARAPDSQSIRDLFIGNYTVRYLIGEDAITILRIWHDKENERPA